MTYLKPFFITALRKSAFVAIMITFFIACSDDGDTIIIGGGGNISYEQAVEKQLAALEKTLAAYPPDLIVIEKQLYIASILSQLGGVTDTYLTPTENDELHNWLDAKTFDEILSIFVHLSLVKGGKNLVVADQAYNVTGYSPDQYVIPDGQTMVQFLQSLMTTSL